MKYQISHVFSKMFMALWSRNQLQHRDFRIFLQREAMAIPRFAEGHVSSSCAEDVRRLRIVDSAIWLTKLGFTSNIWEMKERAVPLVVSSKIML